jgi:putative transposase
MKRGNPDNAGMSPVKEKRPQDWSSQEQLLALQESHALSGEALQAGCRERGLFAHHLASWKAAFCTTAKADSDTREWSHLKEENDQLMHQLSEQERQSLLAVAKSQEFGHHAPRQIVPRLADQGQYIASESTFYRVLSAQVSSAAKPRALCATAPNALFSWDIIYLSTRVFGVYFYLNQFMDIFSRKIVGWQIYQSESSALTSEVMRDICEREKIAPHQMGLHSDDGSSMRGPLLQSPDGQ